MPPGARDGRRISITPRRRQSAAFIARRSGRPKRCMTSRGCSAASSRPADPVWRCMSDRRRDDARELGALGYAQELFRTIGGFSNFAISFSIISILTGAVTLYSHGLIMGGPAEMAYGWPLVSVFTLAVAASMAELASSMPTSGAMYHWSCRLGGTGWGWFTAWFNIVGQLAALAGIDYGCALFVTPLIGLPTSSRNVLIVYGVVLLSHAVINHVGIRVV